MNAKGTHRLVTTTAILGVIAALLVAPANARFVDPDSGGNETLAAQSVTGGGSLGVPGEAPLTRELSTTPASTEERHWTSIGIGSGGGALLLAAFAALYFSGRPRERQVAMP